MANLITDPSFLSQGNTVAWTTSNPVGQPATSLKFTNSGVNVGSIANATIATSLPSFDVDDHFEIRSATSANNNGLYKVTTVTSDTEDYVVAKLAGSQGSMTTTARDDTPFILGSDAVAGNTTPGISGSVEAATGKSVYYDTYSRKIWLIRQGNLGDEGVTLQSLYSFTKEEWKNDPYLIKFDFPFDAITPEQFEFKEGWRFYDNAIAADVNELSSGDRFSRDLVRTGGWTEFNENNIAEVVQQYTGVITLGTFEDDTEDRAYVQFGDDSTDITAGQDDFVFFGPVNEAIRTYDIATTNTGSVTFAFTGNTITRSAGNWLTEGYNTGGRVQVVTSNNDVQPVTTNLITSIDTANTVLRVGGNPGPFTVAAEDSQARIAYDNRNAVSLFLRGNSAPSTTSLSKSYDSSDLGAIGVTTTTNQVYRFPLTNSLDAKISVNDVDVDAASYPQIRIRYFSGEYSKEVETGVTSDFGIVIDAGTFSGIDGSTSGTGVFSTAAAGIEEDGAGTYDNGTLTIHEGPDAGIYTIDSSTDNSVTIAATTFGSETDQSFTLKRQVPIFSNGPTIEEIYNRIQFQLRQDANINETSGGGVVTGATADELLAFVGDAITGGSITSPPENPEGGGTGVIIEGFNANDTNDVTFVDDLGISRNFPFLASGNIDFNLTLVNDDDAKFWMFFDRTIRRALVNADISNVSGLTADITCDSNASPLTGFTREGTGGLNGPTEDQLQVGDYIRVSGFSSVNNGLWRITAYTDETQITAVKSDGDTPIVETNVSGVFVDENPIDSPDAIIVNNNNGDAIVDDVTVGNDPFAFDFDFTNNSQGKRIPASNGVYAAATDAEPSIVIRAIGLGDSQFIEVPSTISRASGQNIAVNGGQERNYSNPA